MVKLWAGLGVFVKGRSVGIGCTEYRKEEVGHGARDEFHQEERPLRLLLPTYLTLRREWGGCVAAEGPWPPKDRLRLGSPLAGAGSRHSVPSPTVYSPVLPRLLTSLKGKAKRQNAFRAGRVFPALIPFWGSAGSHWGKQGSLGSSLVFALVPGFRGSISNSRIDSPWILSPGRPGSTDRSVRKYLIRTCPTVHVYFKIAVPRNRAATTYGSLRRTSTSLGGRRPGERCESA